MQSNNIFYLRIKSPFIGILGCRKPIFKALPFMAVLFLFSFSSQVIRRDTAIVNRIDGYYIFIESKPSSSYSELGIIESPKIVWNGRPKEMMSVMLKRLKTTFPKADAIIFDDYKLEKATAVKFD